MSDLRALVAGYITGTLMLAQRDGLLVHVDPLQDEAGQYTGEILVTGRVSLDRLIVRVQEMPK